MKTLINSFIIAACLIFLCCNEKEEKQEKRNSFPEVPVINEDMPVESKDNNGPDAVSLIRERVGYINTAKLEKKHFEFMCDEKMMVDYFYDKGEIVKIAIDFGTVGDVYAKEGYYYDKGKLVFVYEFVEGGPACEGCIKTNEYRAYIVDDEAIKYLKDKDEVKCRKCEYSNSSRHYTLLKAETSSQVKAIMCPQAK